jgi:site-specific recombinase XerD
MVDLIDWLVEQGYASTTQRNHVRAAARLGSWMVAKGLTLGNLDASRVVRMVSEDNARHPEHRSANENVSAVVRFLGETGHLRPEPEARAEDSPAEAFLAGWLRFLEEEQGQGVSWIYKARRLGRAFLALSGVP